MGEVSVRHVEGDRFLVSVRGHDLVVDQPLSDGGDDVGPTPTELFVAGLASCVAYYARLYLARHDLPSAGLEVTVDYAFGGRPARVETIDVRVTPPPELPAERRDAFLAVASHCTVHHTLVTPPDVRIEFPGATTDARRAG